MHSTYYVGDFRQDGLNGSNRGWIVGAFMEDTPRRSKDVEIKCWEYKAGEVVNHGTKISATTECAFILKSKTKCLIGNEEIELKQGDYIVIKPGTPSNIVAEILEDVVGLTIKAPSDPRAKKLMD